MALRYHSTKKEITVQDLLVWAYRHELVHAARAEGSLVELAGAGRERPWLAVLAEGFDVGVEKSLNFGFEASADAYVVHRAVLGLGTADLELPTDVVGQAVRLDLSTSAMPQIKRGFRVRLSNLVMTHAIDGNPPDYVPKPKIVIERGEKIYDRDQKGRIRRDARGRARELLQVVDFHGDMPWDVARARLIYRAWVDALQQLQAGLAPRLSSFQLSSVLPPRAPWGLY